MAALMHRWLVIVLVALVALVWALGETGAAQGGTADIGYVDGTGTCVSLIPCYDTIQAAVNHVSGPGLAEVRIFPGTYPESVDINGMASEAGGTYGAITLTTVDASASPVKHTAAIHSADPIKAMAFDHPVTIDGLVLEATSGDAANIQTSSGPIIVRNVTAEQAAKQGLVLELTASNGDDDRVIVEHSAANSAQGFNADGISIHGIGTVNVTDVETDDNARRGITVDTAGAVTINDMGANGNGVGNPFGDGVIVHTETGMVHITNVTAENNGDDGLDIEAGGDILIDGESSFSDNTDGGADLTGVSTTIVDTLADNNGGIGIEAVGHGTASAGGDAQPAGSPGLFSATNVEARDNGDDGFRITTDVQVYFDLVTAMRNAKNGILVTNASTVRIKNSLLSDNVNNGVLLNDIGVSGEIHQNIICGNENGGVDVNSPGAVFAAEGNWWGSVTGPTHPDNPGGSGDNIYDGPARGIVHYDPWISAIEPTVLGSGPKVGEPSTIVWVFTTEDRVWQLEKGPGSDLGSLQFSLATNNGVMSAGTMTATSVFTNIANSKLSGDLIAANVGSATVTMEGPCGMHVDKVVTVVAGHKKGDLNCNDVIDMGDFQRSIRATSGLEIDEIADCPFSVVTLDLDCNGLTLHDGKDPLLLLRKIVDLPPGLGLVNCPPVGE